MSDEWTNLSGSGDPSKSADDFDYAAFREGVIRGTQAVQYPPLGPVDRDLYDRKCAEAERLRLDRNWWMRMFYGALWVAVAAMVAVLVVAQL